LPWKPDEVTVKYKGKDVKFKSNGVILACPANCKITLENAPPVGEEHADKPEPPKPESFEGNDLIPQEKDAMISATCDDKVNGDLRFGPVYAGKPNFDFYIVKCPTGCADGGKVNAYG
jgi:hypothetical protein